MRMGRVAGWIVVLGVISCGFILDGPATQAQGMIQIKGSDSEVNLVQRLAEVFMQKNPDVRIGDRDCRLDQ
jgi:ABC-type phosphate transport system substrate-binding protein